MSMNNYVPAAYFFPESVTFEATASVCNFAFCDISISSFEPKCLWEQLHINDELNDKILSLA